MTEKRKYRKPVAWLGGRDLLANIKYFVLFTAFKGKLDPRDWMRPEVFPPAPEHPGDSQYAVEFGNSFAGLYDKGEFWFDYFADSGDGMTAGYAIAYLCMSELTARLPADWDGLSIDDKRKVILDGKPLTEIRSHLAAGHSEFTLARDCTGDSSKWVFEKLKKKQPRTSIIEAIEQTTCGVVSFYNPKNGLSPGCIKLPRGAFLFVGGDTCYHVADFAGLAFRFQKVFDWAFKDLTRREGLTDAEIEEKYWQESKRRPIFGVPGNHDYYDMIDGFNRQFARSITRETRFINLRRRNLPPQLRLWPFKRFQRASYAAIKLPFDWWFWGIDSELDTVDLRQQEFFKRSYAQSLEGKDREDLENKIRQNLREELQREPTPDEFERRFPRLFQSGLGNIWQFPSKLIIASSEPTTVEGKRAREGEKTPKAFSFLDLTRPFLYLRGGSKTDAATLTERQKIRNAEALLKLSEFKCRLDISGDVHHYARYWGEGTGRDDAPEHASYATVVAGGGGASMSPTETDYNEVEEQTLYPSKRISKRTINQSLFNPLVVFTGGNVWVAGALIAMIVYFAAGVPASHHRFTNSVMDVLLRARTWFGLSATPLPHAVSLKQSLGAAKGLLKPILLLSISIGAIAVAGGYVKWLFERLTKTYDWARDRLLNLQLEHTQETDPEEEKAKEEIYKHFLQEIEGQTNRVSIGRLVLFWISSGLIAVTTISLWSLQFNPSPDAFPRRVLFVAVLAVLIALLVAVYALSLKKFRDFDRLATQFDAELEAWQQTKTVTIEKLRQHVDALRQLTVTSSHDYVPFWALILFPGALNLGLALWRFSPLSGYRPAPDFSRSVMILLVIGATLAAAVVAHNYSKWLFEQSYRIKVTTYSYIPVMFLNSGVVVFIAIALWLFARSQGRFIIADILYVIALIGVPVGCVFLAMKVGNHVYTLPRHAVFLLLGLWHGILQLVVPFLLAWLGSAAAFFWAAVTVGVFTIVMMGLVTIVKLPQLDKLINRGVLPILWVIYGAWMILIPIFMPRANPGIWIFSGWPGLSLIGNLVVAGAIGTVMSCVWLGWYFAVALVFDGHANEAGSTARTEDYKQFIRFRLTEDTLTGFVIGVDFPHAPQSGDDPRDGSTLKPRLVDVFTLTCGPPPEPS